MVASSGLPRLLGAFLLLGFFSLWPGLVQADAPVSVSATVEPETITVGDRLHLSLRLEYPATFTPDLPSIGTMLGPFEVLDRAAPVITELPQNRRRALFRLTLTAWGTGAYEIPSLDLFYEDAEGNKASVATPPLPVLVSSVVRDPAELTDIKDLKPQAALPRPSPLPERGLLIVGLVAMAVAAGVLLLRRRRPAAPRTVPQIEASLSPEEAALQELDRLVALELLSQRAYGPFYTRLSACLRRYLQDRYALRAFDRTTTELRRELRVYEVDRWQALMIEELLKECDAVKFGRYQPALERAETALTAAYEVIRSGMVAPEPAVAEGVP